ncbi:hypothetical protein SAY86_020140 [Trapa natans]|uniref:Glycine-rich protein n=1 Tax=Trapa natans TaxID=22666 RepID=A0AAN7R688_TRANT|nr:hypothetical protein SAY86_020140 [Trapa natans]
MGDDDDDTLVSAISLHYKYITQNATLQNNIRPKEDNLFDPLLLLGSLEEAETKMLSLSRMFLLLLLSFSSLVHISAGGRSKLKSPEKSMAENKIPNDASGSGHGPNWDYSWGWGSGPGTGWGYGSGSSSSSAGSGRGFGYGFGAGSGSGSGFGYGWGGGGSRGGGYGWGSGGSRGGGYGWGGSGSRGSGYGWGGGSGARGGGYGQGGGGSDPYVKKSSTHG